jgi:hypothetical protein
MSTPRLCVIFAHLLRPVVAVIEHRVIGPELERVFELPGVPARHDRPAPEVIADVEARQRHPAADAGDQHRLCPGTSPACETSIRHAVRCVRPNAAASTTSHESGTCRMLSAGAAMNRSAMTAVGVLADHVDVGQHRRDVGVILDASLGWPR